jgi:hypothetical protein
MVLIRVFPNLRNTNSATNWDCTSEGKRIASGPAEVKAKRKGQKMKGIYERLSKLIQK